MVTSLVLLLLINLSSKSFHSSFSIPLSWSCPAILLWLSIGKIQAIGQHRSLNFESNGSTDIDRRTVEATSIWQKTANSSISLRRWPSCRASRRKTGFINDSFSLMMDTSSVRLFIRRGSSLLQVKWAKAHRSASGIRKKERKWKVSFTDIPMASVQWTSVQMEKYVISFSLADQNRTFVSE